MRVIFKISVAALIASGFAGQASAQSYKYYSDQVSKREAKKQLIYPEFRIVKQVEQFPDRINATDTFDITTSPMRTIVTLYDRNTGAPLESCLTPCTLHREPGVGYGIYFYKKWYWPKSSALRSGKFGYIRPLHMDMGMNYYTVRKKQKKCLIDFNNSEKIDGDAKPCYRRPPTMPRKAKKSGHCIVTFDVSEKGKPLNVATKTCSDDLFSKPSTSSVKWWRYTPKVERGEAVPQYGVESKITFKLKAKDGILVPE